MPAPEVADRYQKALLWTAQGFDRYGQYKRSIEPIELDVIWNKSKSKVIDALGNDVSLDAELIVDREIPIGSTMWQGSMEDMFDSLAGTGTAAGFLPTSNLMKVVTSDATDDIKGRETLYKVSLKRLGETMPTVGNA